MCEICEDSGSIFRPERIVERTIWLDNQKQFIKEKTGGIDACPACAAKARVQWEIALAE
jgi:hypothetical protein